MDLLLAIIIGGVLFLVVLWGIWFMLHPPMGEEESYSYGPEVTCLRCNRDNDAYWVRKTKLCFRCKGQILLSPEYEANLFGEEEHNL